MILQRLCQIALLAAASLAHSALYAVESVSVLRAFQLPQTRLESMGQQGFSAADLNLARTNGLRFDNLPSLGSGLARIGTNEFVGISDRGPNGEVGGKRTFPLPKFCPFISRFKLLDGKIAIEHSILLTDTQGLPLSGLSNMEGQERLFESAEARIPLPFDPNGVDPEAIRVFPDGKFLISEEYGPSILVIKPNGQVLMRYMPENKSLPRTTYPARAILPRILAQRRTNRGFESLALSPDGRIAYALLQSPVGDVTDERYKNCRIVRVVRLDLTDPLNANVTGLFLIRLSDASDYGKTQKQENVKLNDAVWLAPDKLLLLETGKNSARLIIGDFSQATNLLGTPNENSLAIEATGDDPAKLGVKPASQELWVSTEGLQGLSHKLEGLEVLSPTEVAVSNDNDFGLGDNDKGEPSAVWILRFSRPLLLTKSR